MKWLPCWLLLAAVGAEAHRSHFGWTDISARDQTLEIVHRFHEHDAALLVSQLTGQPADITQLKSQARFALYVEAQFSLEINGEAVQPTLIGAELDHRYLLVYQEVPTREPIEALTVRASPLMELYEDQLHLVNVVLPDLTATLELSHATNEKSVTSALSQ